MPDARMDERDTMVWAATYAATRNDIAADKAVKVYRDRRGGPSNLFYDGQHFATERELIDYLKSQLYKAHLRAVVPVGVCSPRLTRDAKQEDDHAP